ncbi:MAG TPA: cytochrome c oxidase subunit 4 [Candidatus Dormibacteraeota bacterium]|jgi:ABC-type methionine transport system permease subunit|nr:cytochrome c oxidase subunit 4 [Candidatus Dormibacteraeota bacterium]
MAETTEAHEHHDDEIHMPPNSWAPLWVAVGVTVTMVGLAYLHDFVFIFPIGLLVLVSGITAWVMAAVKEHGELH